MIIMPKKSRIRLLSLKQIESFLRRIFEFEDNGSDNKSGSKSKNDKLDDNLENLNQPIYKSHLENNSWINNCTTKNAKLKLIQILKSKALVPKQH